MRGNGETLHAFHRDRAEERFSNRILLLNTATLCLFLSCQRSFFASNSLSSLSSFLIEQHLNSARQPYQMQS
jgi:hypothetical protein